MSKQARFPEGVFVNDVSHIGAHTETFEVTLWCDPSIPLYVDIRPHRHMKTNVAGYLLGWCLLSYDPRKDYWTFSPAKVSNSDPVRCYPTLSHLLQAHPYLMDWL